VWSAVLASERLPGGSARKGRTIVATSDVTRGAVGAPVRWGLWLIAVAGILCTAIFTYWMTAGDLNPETDPKKFADYATSIGSIGRNVAYLVGIGVLALYGMLAGGREHSLALAGLVLHVASLCTLLAGLGGAIFGQAVVAGLYEEGNTGVAPALVKLNGGTFGTAILVAFLVAVVLAVLGAIATGIAIWRSGALPRWSAVVFGLGFVLFAGSAPLITHLGGILLAIASIWMVRSLAQEAPAAALEARTA
jgi:hypothetical protein